LIYPLWYPGSWGCQWLGLAGVGWGWLGLGKGRVWFL